MSDNIFYGDSKGSKFVFYVALKMFILRYKLLSGNITNKAEVRIAAEITLKNTFYF